MGYVVKRKTSTVCPALINKLDAPELDEIFLMSQDATRIWDNFLGQDPSTCQALINKLSSKKLIEFCHQEGVTSSIKILFTKQSFATCQAFLTQIELEGLLSILRIFNTENEIDSLINSNLKLDDTDKNKLITTLKMGWLSLNNLQQAIRIHPKEFIQFLRQHIKNNKQNECIIISSIQKALRACPEQDKATRHTLQGLLCQAYLNLENLPKPKSVEEKDEKKPDKRMKVPSYRHQAHEILLRAEPAQLGMNPETLEACGESLILTGGGGGDYVQAMKQAQAGTLSTSQSRPQVISVYFNVHRVRLKGLEYFAEALLHIPIRSDIQTAQETFFLSYLGLDEKEGENRRALKDWLKPQEISLENWEEDKNVIVQKKLDALEERAQRVEQVGWDSATQDLIGHLVQQRIQGGDKAAEKFYQGLLSLKFKFELAVGVGQEKLVTQIAREISEHIRQEMIRIEKPDAGLPLSAFYVQSLRNLLYMDCFSQNIPSTTSTSSLEVKTTVPLVNEEKETKAFADLILSLDEPVIKEVMREQKGDDFNSLPLHQLFACDNHRDACLKLIDSLDEKSFIRLVQLRNNQGNTPLHLLSNSSVGEAVINKLKSNPDALADILFLQDAQGQSVAEVVIFKFSDLFKPIIEKLNSDGLFAFCQQETREKTKLVFLLIRSFSLDFKTLSARLRPEHLFELCQMQDRWGNAVAEYIFVHGDKYEIAKTVIDHLNPADLLKICQMKTKEGGKLGHKIFKKTIKYDSYSQYSEFDRFIEPLITKLEPQALAEIFQEEEYAPFLTDFFRCGNLDVCIDLLTRLPAETLAQICQKKFSNEEADYWGGGPVPPEGEHKIYTLVHRILLDRDALEPCHLDFIKKLPFAVLSASAKLIETSRAPYSFVERLLSYKEFKTCQTLITKLSLEVVNTKIRSLTRTYAR